MLYSCTHMATVGVKGLIVRLWDLVLEGIRKATENLHQSPVVIYALGWSVKGLSIDNSDCSCERYNTLK